MKERQFDFADSKFEESKPITAERIEIKVPKLSSGQKMTLAEQVGFFWLEGISKDMPNKEKINEGK